MSNDTLQRIAEAAATFRMIASSHRCEASRMLFRMLHGTGGSSGGEARETVLSTRRSAAHALIELEIDRLREAIEGDLGYVFRCLADASVCMAPAQADDVAVQERIAASRGDGGAATVQSTLAALLYRPASLIPVDPRLDHVPAWFVRDYLRFVLARPAAFASDRDIERYLDHMWAWVAFLYRDMVERRAGGQELNDRVSALVSHADCIMMYFRDVDVTPFYAMVAGVVEVLLRASGLALDYSFGPRPPGRERVRLGVLKDDFAAGTESYVTLSAVEHLDRRRFEIILYCTRTLPASRTEARFRARADRFVVLPDAVADMAATVRADDLDCLLIGRNVSVLGTAVAPLARFRLARATMVASCSPVSPCIGSIDYYLSGTYTEPPSADGRQYRERLLMADGPAHAFEIPSEFPDGSKVGFDRNGLGLPDRAVVFISGANFYKILPRVRQVWAQILSRVEGSFLVLYPFNPNWSEEYPYALFEERMAADMTAAGVDPSRVRIARPLPSREQVLELLALGDIYLDSFPYSGATSLVDPLQLGLPVVASTGATARCRQAYAILRCLDLEMLAPEREEAYVELAVRLGTDKEYRAHAAERVRNGMAAGPRFMDSRWYAGEMARMLGEIMGDLR